MKKTSRCNDAEKIEERRAAYYIDADEAYRNMTLAQALGWTYDEYMDWIMSGAIPDG